MDANNLDRQLIAGILVAIFFRDGGSWNYCSACMQPLLGFVTKAGQGGLSAAVLPILALVLLSLVLAASWVSISKAKGNPGRPVLAPGHCPGPVGAHHTCGRGGLASFPPCSTSPMASCKFTSSMWARVIRFSRRCTAVLIDAGP